MLPGRCMRMGAMGGAQCSAHCALIKVLHRMESKKSHRRKNEHEADNRALKRLRTYEVDATGLPTTIFDDVSRKRQHKSAGRPKPLEGSSDVGGSVLRGFKFADPPLDQQHQRHHKHKHKHRHKRDLSSSLEADAGPHQQIGHSKHKHRCKHNECTSMIEAHLHPEPDTQPITKHKHRHKHDESTPETEAHSRRGPRTTHKHRKQSQSSTVDSSQVQSKGRDRHKRSQVSCSGDGESGHKTSCSHQHKQRDQTELAMDGRLGSTLQVEGPESLSQQQLAEFHHTEDQYSALHNQWVRSTEENRERLREKVGKWKSGRWSVQEIGILKRNVRAFLKEYGVRNLSSLIFSDRSERNAALYRYMAKDIKRPLMNIYRKMVRVFDVEHFVGRWTPEMERELLSLHRLHGNRWKAIGQAMGISNSAALGKYRMLRRKRRGPWSHEEEERLVEAMRQFHTEQDSNTVLDAEDLPDTIRWEDVAERVGSRTHHQCRQKWVLYLCWKQKGGHDQWTFQDDLKLIRTLCSLEEEDEEGVEWGELCSNWPSARSASFLRGKWASLRRDVPNYRIRTFQDNVDWLLEHKAPVLQRRQKALETEQVLTSEESD